jgi:hypothetical protein
MSYLRSGGSVRLLVAVLILLFPTMVPARTIHVSPGEKDGIAGALASANYGDVVVVACGDYLESGLILPDGVTLTGATDDATCVRIQSPGYFPLLHCQDAGPEARVQNLTLTVIEEGLLEPVPRGAGVHLANSSPTLTNVIIEGFAADYGGAVYCDEGSSPQFQHCWFEGNYARATGGAVACVGVNAPQFDQCLFAGNTAEVSGGTINAALGAAPMLTQCTMVAGEAGTGAGLASWDGSIFSLNQVILVNGLQGRGWDGDAGSVPVVLCTDIYGNEGGDWEGALEPQLPMDGNISADPQFCGNADSDNPYTLNDTSPCSADVHPGCMGIGAFGVNCSYVTPVPPGELPLVSRLHPNYPNPFNPRTTIKFELHQSGPVDLAVFDMAGRLVKRLVTGPLPAGHHDAVWEGKDASGRPAAAGVYFFRLKTDDTVDTKRMTLVK